MFQGAVYGRALAVIGVTMDAQRESGMINNRVFEAMSVGAPLISEHFPALEDLFGDAVLYVRRPGDVTRHVEHLLHSHEVHEGRDKIEAYARQRRRAMIEGGHTWALRVEDMLSFASSLPGNGLGLALGEEKGEKKGSNEERCWRREGGCLALAIVIDPDLEEDVTFGSTFFPAVSLLGSVYHVTWLVAPPQENQDRAEGERGRQREESGHGEGEKPQEWRRMRLPLAIDFLVGYDVVWAAGRWGGPADTVVRYLLSLETGPGSRRTMPRLATQARGMVLWGGLCTPGTGVRNERSRGEGIGEGIGEEDCPSYAGDAGLRWYDVVYCQTAWDHEFLVKEAFNGSVSDNLQQAWGFGSSASPADGPDVGGETDPSTKTFVSHDLLVIGTDVQFLDMLQLVKSSGLVSVALAAVASPGGDVVARPALAPALPAADADAGTNATPGGGVTDLPASFSLHVAGSSEGSPLTPLSAEVMLVRSSADAGALARLASVAVKVVIAATGQVGLWATLLTSTSTVTATTAADAHGGRPQGSEHHARVVVVNDGITGDGRVHALVNQRQQGWDSHFYSRRLVAGMTRAFCLGRGTSRISFVRPSAGGPLTVVGVNEKVTVEVRVEDFDVGREGQWCVTAGGRTLLCLLRNEFVIDVHMLSSSLIGSEREWDETMLATSRAAGPFVYGGCDRNETQAIEGRRALRIQLGVELRSNVYRDVLYRSEPVSVLVDPERERTDGTVGCEKDVVVGCKASAGGGSDSSSKSSQADHHDRSGRTGAYRASINVEDFLRAGAIEVVDV